METTAVSMKGLTKRFETKRAVVVDGVSLDIPAGIVYGLLGPNGAGKTTIVRMLSTLLKPSGGTASVNGFDIVTQPQQVRGSVGVLPEDAGLYDRFTAAETLRFYGGLQGLDQQGLDPTDRRAPSHLEPL